jgi:hypothetical protein
MMKPFAHIKKRANQYGVSSYSVHLGYGPHEYVVRTWSSQAGWNITRSYTATWNHAARRWAQETKGHFARVIPTSGRGRPTYSVHAGIQPEDVLGTTEHTQRRAAQEEARLIDKAFVAWKKEFD